MLTLYHLWLSPFCRKVRICLGEKRLEYRLKGENVWDRRPEFLALNPAGDVPVLVVDEGPALSGGNAICEYLDEAHKDPPLIGASPLERAEARRLAAWFDEKFNAEVTDHLVGEKLMKRFLAEGADANPDSAKVRAGHANIRHHLDYVTYLMDRRRWLAGDAFSIADIAAAAHLSCVDYVGDVPWSDYEEAKNWYARVKSRPSFRSLLGDAIPGAPPAKHYADLDF